MTRRWVTALLVAVAAVSPVACSDDGPGAGEARLEVQGVAHVQRDGGDLDTVEGRTDVGPGDVVELVEGSGVLILSGGNRIELREGIGDAAPSRVVMDDTPRIEAGEVLVTAPGSFTLEAAGTSVTVTDGAAQVVRALGVAVSSYDASVSLDSAGQQREVPALREMLVPTLGRPPASWKPLSYDSSDPWDRRYLAAAVEVGETLQSLAQGYTNNLTPGEGRTPGFFRLVLPGLEDEPEFTEDLIDVERSPGETLIGAAITELGRRGGFAERWQSVFTFRDQGALWGLVALDQDVAGTPLLGTVQEAIAESPLAFVEPEVADTPAPPTTTAPPPTTSQPPPTSTTPTTAPPTTTPTTAPPPPEERLEVPLAPVVEPLVDTVGGLVDGLLGLLTPRGDDG